MTALVPRTAALPDRDSAPADHDSAPRYPTGKRRYNRVGGLGLVLAVAALVVSTFSAAAVVFALMAGGVSYLATRRTRRPTSAAWAGVGLSAVALVLALAVAVA